MKRITRDSTIEEVAGIVSEALARHGIDAVLSGGAVVSIYASNAYVSGDLDFVVRGLKDDVTVPMGALGFEREGRSRHWTHPDTDLYVEFPPGPVGVGDRILTTFGEWRTPAGAIRLLTPTQAVMDRLAAFYHWNDRQGLDQAWLIARNQPVDLAEIERWSRDERMGDRFETFREGLDS